MQRERLQDVAQRVWRTWGMGKCVCKRLNEESVGKRDFSEGKSSLFGLVSLSLHRRRQGSLAVELTSVETCLCLFTLMTTAIAAWGFPHGSAQCYHDPRR